ncbi:restriction endonuclease [bacterium AH-315-E09]|nr:restriction endonuclease [bacterium AH-315-E09]
MKTERGQILIMYSMLLFLLLPLFLIFAFLLLFSVYLKKRKQRAYINSGIKIVDIMKGVEFENFLLAHYRALGYRGKITATSNDYGADLIIRKSDEVVAVQAKRYSSKIGIKAVQEIIGSLRYYNADSGVVITNNYFTKNAIELAKANDVELIDRNKLVQIMRQNSTKKIADEIVTTTNKTKNCPICGKKIITRHGKYGNFFGCSNYPKCNFTRKNTEGC